MELAYGIPLALRVLGVLAGKEPADASMEALLEPIGWVWLALKRR